jgi:hypothetical protein
VVGDNEVGWFLVVRRRIFDMVHHREETLALARFLGYLNTDGSISINNGKINCSLILGHPLDVERALADINALCGKRPAVQFRNGGKKYGASYHIAVPRAISRMVVELPGQELGRRSSLPELSWPHFLFEERCPRAVVREFVAGLLGGDGHAPWIRVIDCVDPYTCEQTTLFSLKTRPGHEATLRGKLNSLCVLLAKLGVDSCYVPDGVVHSNQGDKPDSHRVTLTVRGRSCSDTRLLANIGFRYCIQKQLRQCASQTLWRYVERTRQQWLETCHLALQIQTSRNRAKEALTKAKTQILSRSGILNRAVIDGIKTRTLRDIRKGSVLEPGKYLRRSGCIPRTESWFIGIGVRHWFNSEDTKGTYIVNRTQNTLPVFYLPLVSREAVGEQEVFLFPPNSQQSVVGNGIVLYTGATTSAVPIPVNIPAELEIIEEEPEAEQEVSNPDLPVSEVEEQLPPTLVVIPSPPQQRVALEVIPDLSRSTSLHLTIAPAPVQRDGHTTSQPRLVLEVISDHRSTTSVGLSITPETSP